MRLNSIAAAIGYAVVILWILGALGLADFRLYFGPVDSIDCTRNPASRAPDPARHTESNT